MFSLRCRTCPKMLLPSYLLHVYNPKHPIFTSSSLLKDFYKVLGLSKDASQNEIKTAFYDLAMKHHPDVCGDSLKRGEFQDILEAYKVLSDPKQKDIYDAAGYTTKESQHEEKHAQDDQSMAGNLSKDEFFRQMFFMFKLSFALVFIPKLVFLIIYYL
jgi:curved DNA-binding protein CbpA